MWWYDLRHILINPAKSYHLEFAQKYNHYNPFYECHFTILQDHYDSVKKLKKFKKFKKCHKTSLKYIKLQ